MGHVPRHMIRPALHPMIHRGHRPMILRGRHHTRDMVGRGIQHNPTRQHDRMMILSITMKQDLLP